MPYPERFNVLGIGVSALNLQRAREAILSALRAQQKGYVCVTGVHGISEAQTDATFRAVLNGAFLNTPDGMPLVWLGKLLADHGVDRVYGPDLMLEVFEATQNTEFTHFFYGGAPGIAQRLKDRMEERFPETKIVGIWEPPFRPLNEKENRDLSAYVSERKPDIIWVGLSTPKQEKFMAEYLPRLQTTLMFGVGAAFDFHSGAVRQAPRWIQRSGFEWLFRLCCQPARLARRYLVNNPLFIGRISLQLAGFRKYPLK